MKKVFFTILVMAGMMTLSSALSSCSGHDDEPQTTAELTLDAYKFDYANRTRTVADGGVFTWQTTDKAYVYTNGWGKKLGELSPIAEQVGSMKTKLDGTVSSAGVSVGDQLVLISPRDEWSYLGQDGTLSSLSTKYDYATSSALVLYIDSENNNKIYASNAIFNSEQSLVKFVILDNNGSPLNVPSLTIIAASNKLVQKCSLDGTASAYGNLVITPASPTNVFYVAMRNDKAGADSYTLTVSTNTTVYSYSKSDYTFAKGDYKTINVKMKDLNDTYTERIGYNDLGEETWE